jgi:peptide-methionine (S)-S-oxide reductase
MGGYGDYPSYTDNYTLLNYSETLRLEYDPAKLSYSKLLDAYWKYGPDPTFPCSDPPYEMRLFYTSANQQQAIAAAIQQQRTQLNASTLYVRSLNASAYQFWKAREYHQQYDYKGGMRCGQNARSCSLWR